MQNKTIAVIMSLYKNDRLEFVKPAVESILRQTYNDFDFYVQYDGYVKDEVDVYLSGLEDVRMKMQRRAENKGLAQSLNDLLFIVMHKGYEFIARMDADDICVADRFQRQFNFLQANSDDLVKSLELCNGYYYLKSYAHVRETNRIRIYNWFIQHKFISVVKFLNVLNKLR